MIPWDAEHTSSIPPYLSICVSVPPPPPSPYHCMCLSVFVSLSVYLLGILRLSLSVFSLSIFPPLCLFASCLQTDEANKCDNMRGPHQKQTCTLMIRKMQIYAPDGKKFTTSSVAQLLQIKHLPCLLVEGGVWFPYMGATNDLACVTWGIQFSHFATVPRVPLCVRLFRGLQDSN